MIVQLAINQMREKNQQKDRFLVVGVPCDPSQVSGSDSLAQIVRTLSLIMILPFVLLDCPLCPSVDDEWMDRGHWCS